MLVVVRWWTSFPPFLPLGVGPPWRSVVVGPPRVVMVLFYFGNVLCVLPSPWIKLLASIMFKRSYR
jgi:hypothetical protein